MIVPEKDNQTSTEQEWENPSNPEKPTDDRENEQVERQVEEAKRRKDNLTETDHLDQGDK